MELLFLGTCACDYSPLLKTELRDCFDRNARRSSCALLDSKLMIDCGDHAMDSLRIAGIDLASIEAIVVTHSHGDHFRAENVAEIAAAGERVLKVFCSSICAGLLAGIPNVSVQPLAHGIEVEWNGYRILPLRSNHRTAFPDELTLHYLIEKDGKKLFYGLDGAWYPTDTGKRLYQQKIDLFVFDATVGDYDGDIRTFEHNSVPMIRTMLKAFRAFETFAPDAKIFLSHLAPSLYKPLDHDAIVERVAPDGVLVAYDGLVVTV